MPIKGQRRAKKYLESVGLLELLTKFDAESPNRITSLVKQSSNSLPISVDYIDLARLHNLVVTRKILNILELGSGYSTLVLAHALMMNSKNQNCKLSPNLRRENPWHLDSVDESLEWSELAKSRLPKTLLSHVSFHQREVTMGAFHDRPVTYYRDLPNRAFDLLYIDGPSQYAQAVPDWIGFNIASPERMPMSADALRIEYFLQPGTLVLFDGRRANSDFFENNLQGKWKKRYSSKFDQTLFENRGKSLGRFNSEFLKYWGRIEF